MKHILFTFSILFLTLSSGLAQDVPEVQQSLITKITATWCPNCGGWGWTFFDNLYDDNADKAVLIAAHYSGELQTSVSSDFATNFGVNYQPFFILGNENQNVSAGNAATKRMEIENAVDNNYLSDPIANAGLIVSKNGNSLSVQTKTRFFQNASGDYYLGVYVIEDGVVNYQANQGNDAVHKKVMRASMSDSSFGELIASGSISADTEFTKEYSIDISSWNENNLEIATILWKKEGNTYYFVNTNSTTELSTVGITEISEEIVDFDVYPTVTKDVVNISLDIKEEIDDVYLDLIDPTGRVIKSIFNGEAVISKQNFELSKSTVGSNGLYFIMLRSGKAVSTKKVVFQ